MKPRTVLAMILALVVWTLNILHNNKHLFTGEGHSENCERFLFSIGNCSNNCLINTPDSIAGGIILLSMILGTGILVLFLFIINKLPLKQLDEFIIKSIKQ